VNILGEVIGELCKTILPIPEESYSGNPDSSIAIQEIQIRQSQFVHYQA